MNERIRQLAEKANIEFTYDPTETPVRAFVECWEDELEKFAELIVLECADFVAQNTLEDQGMWGKIVRHFGVEE
jgi:hypothetical protein